MFNEQTTVNLSPQPPFLKGKGESAASPRSEGIEGRSEPDRNIVIGQKVTDAKVQRAKELRENMTETEKILWQSLPPTHLNLPFPRREGAGG